MDIVNMHADEFLCFAQGFLPIDMSSGNNAGDWFNMGHYSNCAVVLYKRIGTAAQDPTLDFEQATDNTGSGVKDLTTVTRIARKQAATNLLAVGSYTVDEQTAAASYTNGTLGEEAAIIVVTVRAEDLDVDNGFSHLRVSVDDTGADRRGYWGPSLYRLRCSTRHQRIATIRRVSPPLIRGGPSPPRFFKHGQLEIRR